MIRIQSWQWMLVALAVATLAGCPSGGGGPQLPEIIRLTVQSTPAGARIFLDGEDTAQTTPATLSNIPSDLLGTLHHVRLVLAGFNDYNTLVTTYADQAEARAMASLTPQSTAPGSLRVTTFPAGARVVLDSTVIDNATPLSLADIPATHHVLRVSLDGFEQRIEEVVVSASQESVVELQMEQLGAGSVSGTVYNLADGALVVGAQLTLQPLGQAVRSGPFGTYVFENVPPGTYAIQARKVFGDGSEPTGSRGRVVVPQGGGRVMTADVGVALPGTTGSVAGTIIDDLSRPVEGATVYADLGFMVVSTVTDANGQYAIFDLPPRQTFIVASKDSYLNAAAEVLPVVGQETMVSLRIQFEFRHQARFPRAPEIDGAQALTFPRPEDVQASAYLAIRAELAARSGLPPTHPRRAMFEALRKARLLAGTRFFPPAGTNIETDIFWFANSEPDLAGYRVYRSTDPNSGFQRIQKLEDPNATFLADVDPNLGAGQVFFYDMDAFTTLGFESDLSGVVSTVPLDRLDLVGPTEGEAVPATPTLSWRSVPGAIAYQVFVYSQLPDFDTLSAGNQMWVSPTLGGEVNAIQYGEVGTAEPLQPGQTYFWLVLAGTDPDFGLASALTVSAIRSFTVAAP